jgi:protein-tyrosine phosphatase
MQAEQLAAALIQAESVIETQPATYLHCFAGRERSALVAVGLLARSQGLDVLKALERVRLCHPSASPIFSDLDQLERLIKTMTG